MVKVITYGTYDLLHYGHIRLLERAKALGDYLIVGVTSDDFDKSRGKINVTQSLMERVEAVKKTGIADEIIIEEYEGQKIDDIVKYNVDIFTVGSDWVGKFDYLKEYCKVIYLERTKGLSSSEIRDEKKTLRLGLVGSSSYNNKVAAESYFVNGIDLIGIAARDKEKLDERLLSLPIVTGNLTELLPECDAVYIRSHPTMHYEQIKEALEAGKHVLCESPIAIGKEKCEELFRLAREKNLVLMEALKTAYATAYERMLLLIKAGKIGKVVSVDATCTSMKVVNPADERMLQRTWNSITEWGITAMLPVLQILGTDYKDIDIITHRISEKYMFDSFTKINFLYSDATATIKAGLGVKSEGELIVSGTKGYIYVPAPWWKTDYFEIRYENPVDNKRYFYQLDGEGIRYELVAFVNSVNTGRPDHNIEQGISREIAGILEDYYEDRNLVRI